MFFDSDSQCDTPQTLEHKQTVRSCPSPLLGSIYVMRVVQGLRYAPPLPVFRRPFRACPSL
ncbi:MAG: hypothetical protein IKP34_01250 [Bacteroidales bacterium]|nr:hypothetical protein [Bacteroidales bacterium]